MLADRGVGPTISPIAVGGERPLNERVLPSASSRPLTPLITPRVRLAPITAAVIALLVVAACAATPTTEPSPAAPSQSSSPVAPPSQGTPPQTSPPSTIGPVETPPLTPAPPAPGAVLSAIAAGVDHTCVLLSDGRVKCWGGNDFGQLGDGATADSSTPVDVAALAGGVSAIATGASHTCAITSSGGVTCFGGNGSGQLGNASTSDSLLPVEVVGMSTGVTAIDAGGAHTCALTTGGEVWCWGSNEYGQLGDGSMTDSSVPVAVRGLTTEVAAIAAGDIHTCALTVAGGVTCWGYRGSGGSGSGDPADIAGLTSGVRAISAGYGESCALTSAGTVKCWGGFSGGAPADVSGLQGAISTISGGFTHTCALTARGEVRCWGGSGDRVAIDDTGTAAGVTAIAVGAGHVCALMRDGGARCWGKNWHGQLGDGRPCSTWSQSAVPVDVRFDAATAPVGPSASPTGRIEHATGPNDVVFRFDRRPDFAVGDLVGELFQPGPEFTLYGDGTVIFRNELTEPLPAEGPIVRGQPFRVTQLGEDQVQALLRFVLDEGGLRTACDRYETQDTDVVSSDVFTVRAGGLDKRVENLGSGPLAALYAFLGSFDGGGDPHARTWQPTRYWGNLLDASIFQYIGDGSTPGLAEAGSVPWPWPGIAPEEFSGLGELSPGRRIMSADEAAVLGLSDNGGVVQRVYLIGPHGSTMYYFSLWPMLPDETTPPTTSAPPPAAWPVRASARYIGDRVQLRRGPEGGLFVLIPGVNERSSVLALLDANGRPRPGWPIAIDAYDCHLPQPADGEAVYVACAVGGDRGATVMAFTIDGRGTAGWPVEIPGAAAASARVIGGLFAVLAYEGDSLRMVAVERDGTVHLGAAIARAPGNVRNSNAQLGVDGTAFLLTYPPARTGMTEITAFDMLGERSDWLVRVAGRPAGLAFGGDARIFVTENQDGVPPTRVLVFDTAAKPLPGASAALPVAATSAYAGAGPFGGAPPPVVVDDGTAFLVTEHDGTTVYRLNPDGALVAGWPYRDAIGLQWSFSSQADIGGSSRRAEPAVGPGGVLYLLHPPRRADVGGSVVAIGPDGRIRDGWPVGLTRPGAAFASVIVGPDGTAYALAVEPEGGETFSATILALAPDSTVVWTTTIVEP